MTDGEEIILTSEDHRSDAIFNFIVVSIQMMSLSIRRLVYPSAQVRILCLSGPDHMGMLSMHIYRASTYVTTEV